MSDPSAEAEAARNARDTAKARLSRRFSSLKGEYEEKGIGSRVGDQIAGKAKDAAQGAVEMARESKGVLAGVAGLLGLWFARRPLAGLGRKIWAKAKAKIDKDF